MPTSTESPAPVTQASTKLTSMLVVPAPQEPAGMESLVHLIPHVLPDTSSTPSQDSVNLLEPHAVPMLPGMEPPVSAQPDTV